MTFYVGQRVVCVDDRPPAFVAEEALVKGQIYTIAKISIIVDGPNVDKPGVKLAEQPKQGGLWLASRFRPIEYKAMELFRRIAANPKTPIREDA